MRLIIFFLALTIVSAAHAATISVKSAANGEPALVTVDGDLQANDGDQFRSKTSFLSKAIISFRSAGGSVVAGIQIGESIRLKGFTTVVAGTARCASACAIAWLGGTPRLMSPQAPECREDCAEQSASLYEAEGLKSDVEPLYNIQRYYAEAELLY